MNLGVSDETKLKKIEPNTDEYIKELSEELLRFFNTQFVHNAELTTQNIMTMTQQLGINVIICEKESITDINELDEIQKRFPIAVIYDLGEGNEQRYGAPKDVGQLLFTKK